MSYIFGPFSFILWPIIVIGLIILVMRRRGAKSAASQDRDWYLQLALSKEDAISQWFLLLSVFFLGITLLNFNREIGSPFHWRIITLVTSLVGLGVAYYFRIISTLIFSLIGVVTWWVLQATDWMQNKDIKSSAILASLAFIALLFYSLAHLHEIKLKYKRMALVYKILGIVSITCLLFVLSSKLGLNMLESTLKGGLFFGSWQITVSLLLITTALVGTTVFGMLRKLILTSEFVGILLLTVLFGVLIFLPEQSMLVRQGRFLSGELSTNGIFWAIIFNLAIFFELLGLIFSGYLRKEEWLVNVGTLFLFLLIIAKYFDWFFSFLDKSIFFIGAGILLFVVGWFMEKGRKYMIANMKGEVPK